MNRAVCYGRAAIVVPVVLALITALALISLRSAAPASAQATTVSIVDFSFSPSSVEVTAGSTVTWVNNGAAPHTATGDAFDTGNIAPGGSASVTFDTPGTYSYICSIHPQMTGTIVVTAGGETPAPAPTAGSTTTPTTNLPATGIGAVAGPDTALPPVAALLVLAAAFGLAGLALRGRAAR